MHYLILLDLIMPETDGYAFLEALQHREQDAYIPIIVLTAGIEAERKLAHRQVPILFKPFKFAPLLAAIQHYC